MSDPINLTELRRLCEEATAGPWTRASEVTLTIRGPHPKGGKRTRHVATAAWDKGTYRDNAVTNAALIIAARNALPALLRIADAAGRVRDAWDMLKDREVHIEAALIELRAALAQVQGGDDE